MKEIVDFFVDVKRIADGVDAIRDHLLKDSAPADESADTQPAKRTRKRKDASDTQEPSDAPAATKQADTTAADLERALEASLIEIKTVYGDDVARAFLIKESGEDNFRKVKADKHLPMFEKAQLLLGDKSLLAEYGKAEATDNGDTIDRATMEAKVREVLNTKGKEAAQAIVREFGKADKLANIKDAHIAAAYNAAVEALDSEDDI